MAAVKIKVLVVDDSAVIRNILSAIIEEQPDMTVVGTAPDPLAARDLIAKLNPDVLTLDIEMPHMNGLAFLKRLMAVRPMPVVMLSTHTQDGSDVAFQALSLGAVEVVGKPAIGAPVDASYTRAIVEAIRGAHEARHNLQVNAARPSDAKAVLPNLGKRASTLQQVIVMGAATGGAEAVREIVTQLPDDAPPVVLALHLPPGISRHFVKRLQAECKVAIREAAEGEPILPGHVYIAPSDNAVTIARYESRGYGIRLQPAAPGDRIVDALFLSTAEAAGSNACGVILTGNGNDGAEGLLAISQRQGHTIAQDEATSLVHAMPRAALEAGAVVVEAPLDQIAKQVLAWASWAQV
jgi:two-component system chemotaxis response regulator CheB